MYKKLEECVNTVIFKNPYDNESAVFDLSFLNGSNIINKTVTIEQNIHGFQVGDVLYFDLVNKKFAKAMAINTAESEACGVVSDASDINRFSMLCKGNIKTKRYDFEIGTELYLSESSPGKLITGPLMFAKKIAEKTGNGIYVNIQRGFKIDPSDNYDDSQFSLEPYTKEELDIIIKNIRG